MPLGFQMALGEAVWPGDLGVSSDPGQESALGSTCGPGAWALTDCFHMGVYSP